MKRVVYSGAADAWMRIDHSPEVCILPRRLISVLRRTMACNLVATEDLSRTPTWLWLNEAVQEGTALFYVRVSSYKFDSDKARRLERLAEISRNVYLVDVTPFCGNIMNLYDTWRFIDRSILGYQHHYAFAGGHHEVYNDRVVSSLDPQLNASKIAPHCILDRNPILEKRSTIDVRSSKIERDQYIEKREALFASKRSPQPILTGLADLVHSFDSRRSAVLDVANKNDLIIVNLDSYAKWYRDRGLNAATYSKPNEVQSYARIVFAEPPIIYPFRRIHIEADAGLDCEAIEICGDNKVDSFLSNRSNDELGSINDFCRLLREEHESLSREQCSRGDGRST